MPLFTKRNTTQKEMTDCKVQVDGKIKQGLEMLVKVNGKWKEVWSNTAIYIVSNISYEMFELHYDIIDETVHLENLVVAVYDRNDKLITTMTWDTFETTSGSDLIYDNNDSYGEVGIRTDVANNKLIFAVSIYYESEARKFVITADKVSFS
jgi:hypothetical protein